MRLTKNNSFNESIGTFRVNFKKGRGEKLAIGLQIFS